MNRTQKRIIGWALIAIGTVMLVGVVVNAVSTQKYKYSTAKTLREIGMDVHAGSNTTFDLEGLLVNPLFYLGIALAVGGVVVLKGDTKTDKSSG